MSLAHVAAFVLPNLDAGHALAKRELRTLVRVVEVFLQTAPVPGLTAERAAANIERFLVVGRSRRAWRVRVLLTAIEISTLPTHRRRFSQLSLEARTRVVREEWAGGHHFYRILGKIRNLAILGIYAAPEAQVASGYVPVPKRSRFVALAGYAE